MRMSFINFDIERDLFHDTVYEKDFYVMRQAIDQTVFCWSQLDDALYSWESHGLEMKLYKNGQVSAESFTETYIDLGTHRTRIVKDVLYNHLKCGATLVLNKLHLYHPVINDVWK
jgi:hypothetical protein